MMHAFLMCYSSGRGGKSTTNINTDEQLEPITEKSNEKFQITPVNKNKHLHIPTISTVDGGNDSNYKNVDPCTPLESDNECALGLMNNSSARYDHALTPITSSSLALKSNNFSNSVSGKNDTPEALQSTTVPLIVIKDVIEREEKEAITPTSKDSQNVDHGIVDMKDVHLDQGSDDFVEHLDDVPPDGPARISSFESSA